MNKAYLREISTQLDTLRIGELVQAVTKGFSESELDSFFTLLNKISKETMINSYYVDEKSDKLDIMAAAADVVTDRERREEYEKAANFIASIEKFVNLV